jgi:uncharacterized protein
MELPVKVGSSSKLKGIRCVIATRKILKDEIIEKCPVIPISNEEIKLLEKTIFTNYVYAWNDDADCMVLGYGSIYNHSFESNADYFRDLPNKTLNYIAIRDIKEGEEITVNYNGEPLDKTKLHKDYLNHKL